MAEAIDHLARVSDGIQRGRPRDPDGPDRPALRPLPPGDPRPQQSSDKEVVLRIEGEKTELDKRMIDELGDPLVHLVRNAVDHGLEPPEAREAAGKPRVGTVSLAASHRGNSVVITVSDDGRGIDREKVRRKAVAKGLIGEEESHRLTDRQVVQYIFHPGLSTAETVTDISGRGVGMDIVKSRIEALNGTVDVRSEPGRGTTFTIRLPLTLAIMSVLLARVGEEVYAIPLDHLDEIVEVGPDQVYRVHGRRSIEIRGRIISLRRPRRRLPPGRPEADRRRARGGRREVHRRGRLQRRVDGRPDRRRAARDAGGGPEVAGEELPARRRALRGEHPRRRPGLPDPRRRRPDQHGRRRGQPARRDLEAGRPARRMIDRWNRPSTTTPDSGSGRIFERGAEDASAALSKWLGQPATLDGQRGRRGRPGRGLRAPRAGRRAWSPPARWSWSAGSPASSCWSSRTARAWPWPTCCSASPRARRTTWGELEQSAANETANIVGCAYLNSLAAQLPRSAGSRPTPTRPILPSPPSFRHEFAGSLLEFALMDQAISSTGSC